jgi:hypothetical protein
VLPAERNKLLDDIQAVLSPDGFKLAYIRQQVFPQVNVTYTLWVLDLATRQRVDFGLSGGRPSPGAITRRSWPPQLMAGRCCWSSLAVSVLVTTRYSELSVWGSHVVTHKIQALPDVSGGEVLLDLAPRRGHLVRQDSCPRLWAVFHALPGNFAEFMGPEELTDEARMRRVVMSTWELSLRALQARGVGEARALLRVLSCFAPSVPIPVEVLGHEPLETLFRKRHRNHYLTVLRALESVGLVDALALEGAGWGVVVHPMVSATAWHQMHDVKSRRIIGRYWLSPVDAVMPPLVAALLISEEAAAHRHLPQHHVIFGHSRDVNRSNMMVIMPPSSDTPWSPTSDQYENEAHQTEDDLGIQQENDARESGIQQIIAAHIMAMLRYEAPGLPDWHLASLIRAAGASMPDLMLGFFPEFEELRYLVSLRLKRWGDDPAWALANMNIRHPVPGIDYSRNLSRLV